MASELDKQLEQAAREFVNDTKRNIISKDKIQLSEIFKWFKEDFTKKGTIIDFLNQYANIKIAASAAISYIDYDWKLNK